MKETTFFIAGAVFAEIVILFTIGRPVIQLTIGFALAIAILVVALCLCGIRRAARLLNALADAWTPTRPMRIVPLPSTSSELEDDLVSALINQGVRESTAHRIASTAAKDNHEFDPAFRAALQLIPKGRNRA